MDQQGGMKICATCRYFELKEPKNESQGILGRCHRHAPTDRKFPVVMVNDFCGDHRLDENKVSAAPAEQTQTRAPKLAPGPAGGRGPVPAQMDRGSAPTTQIMDDIGPDGPKKVGK